MALIPKKNIGEKLAELIYKGIQDKDGGEQWLTKLGASSIGNECRRALWYSWRGFNHEVFEGRILRLFGTGHQQEARIIADMRQAGAEIWDKDEETGKQYRWLDETGHFICKPDGVIRWAPYMNNAHILEVKSHNDKSYVDLVKNGVRVSKPDHNWQMQSGMYFSGLHAALYVGINKNDEQLHLEIVERDEVLIRRLYETKESVIKATIPPARISENQSLYSCQWCPHLEVCAGREGPLINCRTCVHSKPIEDGEWACMKHGTVLDHAAQLKGCEDHEPY